MNAASYQSDSRPAGPVASNSFKRGCLFHFPPALTGCRAKPPARQPGAPVPGKHHLGGHFERSEKSQQSANFQCRLELFTRDARDSCGYGFRRSLVVEKPGPQQITSSAGVLPLRFAQRQDDSLEILELETATV